MLVSVHSAGRFGVVGAGAAGKIDQICSCSRTFAGSAFCAFAMPSSSHDAAATIIASSEALRSLIDRGSPINQLIHLQSRVGASRP